MRLAYVADPYRSHRRAARDNIAALALSGHTFVDTFAEAEGAIVHVDWERVAAVKVPLPYIAYCVWETTELPPEAVPFVRNARAIWTPSRYSAAAFSKHHASVHIVPHVCADTPAITTHARMLMGTTDDTFTFFAMGKQRDRRKGIDVLLEAFARVNAVAPRARLVLKSDEQDPPIDEPYVRQHRQALDDVTIRGMYALADAYVSAHRGEAWGYTVSDAIAYGVPTIATAYSGNLDYMSAETSWLVRAKEGPATHGAWGEPDVDDLVAKMCEVIALGDIAKQRASAAQAEVLARFSSTALATTVAGLEW